MRNRSKKKYIIINFFPLITITYHKVQSANHTPAFLSSRSWEKVNLCRNLQKNNCSGFFRMNQFTQKTHQNQYNSPSNEILHNLESSPSSYKSNFLFLFQTQTPKFAQLCPKINPSFTQNNLSSKNSPQKNRELQEMGQNIFSRRFLERVGENSGNVEKYNR